MRLKHFLNRVEHSRVHNAVQEAERGTAARVVVYITHHKVTEVFPAAEKTFQKLGMETSTERAGLLFFLAPKAQKFAVLGGTALHAKLGQPWWDHLAAVITRHFKEERYTDGLVEALAEASQALHLHFPRSEPRPRHEHDVIED